MIVTFREKFTFERLGQCMDLMEEMRETIAILNADNKYLKTKVG